MSLSSQLGSYDHRPQRGLCWMDARHVVPEDRQGRIPELCSDACHARWVALYSLDGAVTHVVTPTGWAPITATPPGVVARPITEIPPETPTSEVDPVPPPRPVPGSWLPFRGRVS
ncbi:hypothetical protein JOF41_007312 [Saccharothrix coeruleofusca]|uniref:hypothetical protein n=1 Tax=Saccharothrix coeruleofusca TaxID=33919 RepID=UPI001AE417A2|nr:hypothetical protein [Saccharothrix coeruleofusca]MBP2341058.1 hypothetical protein [Saccharothrix coeruleofusca]